MTILDTANAIDELANLYYLQSVLERMLVHTEQTKGTAQPRVITVVNDSLYRLAAIYYDNADEWGLIAEANKLDDPEIVGIKVLVIPEWDGHSRGGVLDA